MTKAGETEIIRFPKAIREKLNLHLQDIVTIEQESVVLRLRVREAYLSDVHKNKEVTAFLAETNFNAITSEGFEINLQSVEPFTGLTLGADPECLITDAMFEKVYAAQGILKHYCPTTLTNAIGKRVKNYGFVGWDGQGTPLEFRPSPVVSTNVDGLVNNFRNLIRYTRSILPENLQLAGHTYWNSRSCGFHLHFGLPEVYINGTGMQQGEFVEDENDFEFLACGVGYEYMSKLIIDALNFYVGTPLILFDDEQQNRVWKSKYGRHSNSYKMHQFTLEYRTPGGNNLRSPELTKNLIDICHLVVANNVSLLENLTKGYRKDYINDDEALEKNFTKALGLGNLQLIKNIIDRETIPTPDERQRALEVIQRKLSDMTGYSEEKYPFLTALQQGIFENTDQGMFKNWRADN